MGKRYTEAQMQEAFEASRQVVELYQESVDGMNQEDRDNAFRTMMYCLVATICKPKEKDRG